MKLSYVLFAVLAILAAASAVKFRKVAKQNDCSWSVNYNVNGNKGTATINVPAKGNKLSGSGKKCESNGIAKGTITFDGKGGKNTVGISAEFGKKGVSAGAIIQALKDADGEVHVPAAYYLNKLSYGDLVNAYLSRAQ
mmetsp:Transcript_69387/g.80988  ORF Transcript_69387/g.80988 Transcript_69387/m.80988 type:complete len:138 (+) Transcript_69387:71-484(+)